MDTPKETAIITLRSAGLDSIFLVCRNKLSIAFIPTFPCSLLKMRPLYDIREILTPSEF